MRELVLALSALALIAPTVRAQQVSVRVVMTTDKVEVPVGDTFRLQVRADVTGANVDDIALPSLEGFVVRSRQIARPMQFSFGFGGQQQMVQSSTIHNLVLEATRPGRFELSPARVTAGGQTHQSDSVVIVVGGSNAAPDLTGANPANPSDPPRALGDGAQYDPTAFLRTVVSETEPYVGQQIDVTLYLYSRVSIRVPHMTREPGADGFWVHDLLPPSRTLDAQRQVINGVPFDVYVIRRFAAFPLREGELSISAPEMRIETGSLRSIFNTGGGETLERTGVPVTVSARALPTPIPANPLVGNATVEVTADRNQVRTGDAVTIRAVVRGSGNLRDVRFSFPEVSGLRALQPAIDDQVEQPGDRVGGTRSFEWLVVPEQPGTHTIPAFVINNFDVQTGTFTAVRSEPLTLEAAGNAVAEPDAGTDTVDEPLATEVAVEDFSFGPIRRESALSRHTPAISAAPWYLGVFAFFPLALFGVWVVGRWRARPVDTAKADARRAKQRLDEAERLSKAGESRAFYAEIARALETSLGARLGEAVTGLTHGQLRTILRRGGMDDDLERQILEELEACDFARFSSAGSSQDEMKACLGRARTLLKQIDQFEMERAA